jgi:hypothetical protein
MAVNPRDMAREAIEVIEIHLASADAVAVHSAGEAAEHCLTGLMQAVALVWALARLGGMTPDEMLSWSVQSLREDWLPALAEGADPAWLWRVKWLLDQLAQLGAAWPGSHGLPSGLD